MSRKRAVASAAPLVVVLTLGWIAHADSVEPPLRVRGTWVTVSLAPASASRVIQADESLAAHVYPAGAPGGNLHLRAHFQATVR